MSVTAKSRNRTRAARQAAVAKRERQLPLIRTSERSTFKKCRWVWEREFVDLVKPTTAAPALRFGTLIHSALASYYQPGRKRGPHPAETFLKLYDAELEEQTRFGFRDEEGTWHEAGTLGIVVLEHRDHEAGNLGIAMLQHYVDTYGSDSRYRVLVTEQPFEYAIQGVDVLYVGIMDGVWEDTETGKLYVVDHKTSATAIRTPRHLVRDDQASAYWTFAVEWMYGKGILKRNQKLAGMIYNFLRKAPPDERPVDAEGRRLNKDGSVSKTQPAPFFERFIIHRNPRDREQYYERTVKDIKMMIAAREDPELLINKSPSQFNCNTCWAADICELHEMQADWRGMMLATTQPWDPYAEHEILEGR